MTGRVLITGASGFVGRTLVHELAADGRSVRAAMRQPADIFARSVEVVAVSDLSRPVEWRALLKGVSTVVHLAGIAHDLKGVYQPEDYFEVNARQTAALWHQFCQSRATTFIFLSSINSLSFSLSTFASSSDLWITSVE